MGVTRVEMIRRFQLDPRALTGAASLETATGLGIAGLISLVQFPLRIPSVSPYVLYYVGRSLAEI